MSENNVHRESRVVVLLNEEEKAWLREKALYGGLTMSGVMRSLLKDHMRDSLRPTFVPSRERNTEAGAVA